MAQTADPVKQQRLKEAMSRSRKLIQLDSSGAIDKIAKKHEGSINESLGNGSELGAHNMMTTVSRGMQGSFPQNAQMGSMADKLPSAIVESFKQMPPIGGEFSNSVLGDDLLIPQQPSQATAQEIRQYVNEATQPAQQPVSNGQIDYPMIRTIVEDVMRKSLGSIKKTLNESKDGGLSELHTFTLGKTFKFLDKKGNIYEATLKKIGNINEKRG